MTRTIESMAYQAVFNDVSRKLAALCGRIWRRSQSVLFFYFFWTLVYGKTLFHLSAHPEHTSWIKSSHLICADESFLLPQLRSDLASGQVFFDRSRCLPLDLFHNYFLSPLVTRWPMLHLTSHHATAPNAFRLLLALVCTLPKTVPQHWLLHFLNCQVPINSASAWGNSSISLDGFISPADSKPHLEGF